MRSIIIILAIVISTRAFSDTVCFDGKYNVTGDRQFIHDVTCALVMVLDIRDPLTGWIFSERMWPIVTNITQEFKPGWSGYFDPVAPGTIYVKNCGSLYDTAATIVHESYHALRYQVFLMKGYTTDEMNNLNRADDRMLPAMDGRVRQILRAKYSSPDTSDED